MNNSLEWRIPKESAQGDVYIIPDIITNEDIIKIEEAQKLAEEHDGTIYNDNPEDMKRNKRKSKVKFLGSNLIHMEDIYRKLVDSIVYANTNNFCLGLYAMEILQYATYTEKDKGFYGKHFDERTNFINGFTERKLSFSILLNDPTEFEGGDLILHCVEDFIVEKQKGSIVFFTSKTLHQVTPVTKGIRKSLVGWVH